MATRISPLKIRKGTPLKRLSYQTQRTKGLMAEFDVLKQDFGDQKFENLYANIVNPYANIENVYEEGEIGMKGIDAKKDVLRAGLGTTLDTMRKGAGSGDLNVMGLATALTDQAQQIGVGIEEQELTNINLRKQEAGRLAGLERQGEFTAQQMRIKGAEDERTLRLQQQQALLTLVSGQITAGKAEDYKTKGWLSKLLNL